MGPDVAFPLMEGLMLLKISGEPPHLESILDLLKLLARLVLPAGPRTV
jgi:hypothetical protein